MQNLASSKAPATPPASVPASGPRQAAPDSGATIDVAVYRGAKTSDHPIARERLEWPALVAEVVDVLDNEPPRNKLAMNAIAPHRLRDTCACDKCAAAGKAGPHRLVANVDAVTFMAIDVDRGDPEDVRQFLVAQGWTALVYESSGSTDDGPRFRVLAPTSRDMTVAECYRSRFAFAEALGLAPGSGVEGAKDAAKIFFVGRLPGTRERAHYETAGTVVDVDALLAAPLEYAWGKGPDAAPSSTGVPAATDALAKAEHVARVMPFAIEDGTAGRTCLAAAIKIAELTRDVDATLDVLVRVYGPRCVPPWTDATGELSHKAREAHKLLERDEARLAPTASALEQARAAHVAADANGYHAPVDPPAGVPLILCSDRRSKEVLLWRGDKYGHLPVDVDSIALVVKRDNLPLHARDSKGKTLAGKAIVQMNGTTYAVAVYDFTRARTEYDATGLGTVHVGYPAPAITTAFDAHVDAWLRALGGPSYGRLEAWLASCSQRHIGRLAAALVLLGPADVGKTLLACACAGLWGQATPVVAGTLLAKHNGDLRRCPVVFDDEAQVVGSRELSTKAFRDLVQRTERPIEPKFQEVVLLRGGIRLYIAGNDLTDLRMADLNAVDVVEAVSDRLLVIDAKPRTDACKAALGALRVPGAWTVDRDRIVAHLAWLGATVELPVERFIGGGAGANAVLRGHAARFPELWETLLEWLKSADTGRGVWCVRDGRLCTSPAELAGSLEQRGRGWSLERVNEALGPFARAYRPHRGPRLAALDVDELIGALALDATDAAALAARVQGRPERNEATGQFGSRKRSG